MIEGKKIAVLGGGSFGTAIANMIADNGNSVVLWMRDEGNARRCREIKENINYLPGYRLAENLQITSSLRKAVADSEVVFFSIPSESFRLVVRQAAPCISPGVVTVSSTKGIEESSFDLMSQILIEELPKARVGVLSGPNLALEIARHEITATVIASDIPELCQQVQELLHSEYFRVYASSDRFGVELAGALKNIYAIAAGIASAMNLGQNTLSVLITRSLAEMSRFAVRLGADPLTFLGLSGVGDLFVTCTSPLSRNYRIGYAIGKGKSLDEAVAEVGQIAEGVNTTRIVKHKADELGVYMPLASALYEMMFNQRPIRDLLRGMMLSEQTTDVEFTTGKKE